MFPQQQRRHLPYILYKYFFFGFHPAASCTNVPDTGCCPGVLNHIQLQVVLHQPLLLALQVEQLQRQVQTVRLVLVLFLLRVGVGHHHLLVKVAVELLVLLLEGCAGGSTTTAAAPPHLLVLDDDLVLQLNEDNSIQARQNVSEMSRSKKKSFELVKRDF